MICYLSRNYRGIDSAGNKAKTDIERVMDGLGFRNVGLKQTRYMNKVTAFFATLFSVMKGVFSLREGDVLVLQYPLKKYYEFVCNMAHRRGCKVITIIHNLGSFRRKKLSVSRETKRLNHSDAIIVHSETMKKWLVEAGVKANLEVLGIFDYLSETQAGPKTYVVGQAFKVMFVGALASRHNGFLYELINAGRSYEIVLYGNGLEENKLEKDVINKGFVRSDDLIRTAEGDFGIVWYGDSLEGGEGALGDYLQYNAPHKMSLYLRCELPVVIWEKAALAPLVREANIGLCLSSLAELEGVLDRLTPEGYMEMKRNVKVVSDKLARGFYVFQAIRSACRDLQMDWH